MIEIKKEEQNLTFCDSCRYECRGSDVFPCNVCTHNKIIMDHYTVKEPRTYFEYCCEDIENMAQVIDIAKIGWSKDEILEFLGREIK